MSALKVGTLVVVDVTKVRWVLAQSVKDALGEDATQFVGHVTEVIDEGTVQRVEVDGWPTTSQPGKRVPQRVDASACRDIDDVSDYAVGDTVEVRSFGAWRTGVVTKVGRTRVTVDHAVNVATGRRVTKPFNGRNVRPHA